MKKLLFSFILFIPTFTFAQFVINELMSNNISAVWDDAYNHSMWVEIYNTSSSISYNQTYFYITDDLNEPKKWNPSSKIITPNSYSVLWFERNELTGHSNFKLDPEGGKLYFLNSASIIIDSIYYPAQYRNISFGRKNENSNEWVYFEQSSPGTSNNGKNWASQRCSNPKFTVKGGFYPSTINIKFENPVLGDTIFFTRNGDEPTRKNSTRYTPGFVVTIPSTTIIRAKCFSAEKLSSDIVTSSYFIGERNFTLPVVSIVTEQKNLTDNTYGIYVQGTNGITGNGMSSPANWNQDWDRPANIELIDTTNSVRINQELDITIAGGWTRMNGQKSLKLSPRKKYYSNKLDYDFFGTTKPFMKYKSVLFRNSGNDFTYSMLRDPFMQSLVMKRLDLDCIAYEPAVCFMNGTYYGIQNLRERTDEDYVYSNYGLDDDDFRLVETWEMTSDTAFNKIINYVTYYDFRSESVYNNFCSMVDIESVLNYYMTEIYYGNTDWPANNVKVWKKNINGKWRWILYDLDFGYNLYGTTNQNHNTLQYALGEMTGNVPATWSTIILKQLVINDTFRKKFIDRFCINISSTFEPTRAHHILDSLAAKISTEINYHKTKWGSNRSFVSDINNMKNYSSSRPDIMLSFISERFLSNIGTQTIIISSNNAKASYLFNDETIIDPSINLKYFSNQKINVVANPVPGFKFKHWEYSGSSSETTLIPNNSSWNYFDGNAIPDQNWFTKSYIDGNWKNGIAPLGYVSSGISTTIDYGGVSTNKYPTAYFRKKIILTDLSSKSNFIISTFTDDGVAVYVNGTEIGRDNLPDGVLNFSTLATVYNNGLTSTFTVPANLLIEGENVIAVEVHQISVTSSDLIFNLNFTCQSGSQQILTDPVYSTTLFNNINIKAIYEQTIFEDPDKDLKVVFNEIVASNNIILDENGDKDDYIEVYNGGENDINIAGWYISDSPANPALWKIPTTDTSKTIIPAKDRIIIWMDNETNQGILHAGFKLSKDGETIILSKHNYLGTIVLVDSVTFPIMETNLSYSRVPDGADNWLIQPTTFNATNNNNSELELYSENSINIYPTLVAENIAIRNAAGEIIRIISTNGKTEIIRKITDNFTVLNVSNLQKGVHILTCANQKFKIVKL